MNINQIRQQKPEWNDLDDQQVVSVLKQVYYPDMAEGDIAKAIGAQQPEPPPAQRTALGTAGDVGLSLVKGAISVPEAAVGLMDLPTMGLAGKAAEAVGFRPKEAKAFLDEQYSEAQQQANQRVQQAEGVGDTFVAALQNPSVIAHSAAESLRVPINQNTFDAFSSHAHNFGVKATCASRALELVNRGQLAAGCDALAHAEDGKTPVWSYADGQYRRGLYYRRLDERALCQKKP